MPLHGATITKDGELFCFASVDGEHYLGVNRFPRPGNHEDREQLEAMFAGNGRTKPMTFARRYFTQEGGELFEIDD